MVNEFEPETPTYPTRSLPTYQQLVLFPVNPVTSALCSPCHCNVLRFQTCEPCKNGVNEHDWFHCFFALLSRFYIWFTLTYILFFKFRWCIFPVDLWNLERDVPDRQIHKMKFRCFSELFASCISARYSRPFLWMFIHYIVRFILSTPTFSRFFRCHGFHKTAERLYL